MSKGLTIERELGFSLIELLVSVAIVALLAGIAIPEYSNFRKRANDTKAISQLLDLRQASHVYRTDHESVSLRDNFVRIKPDGSIFAGDTSFFPGYVHQKGVVVVASYNDNLNGNESFTAHAAHCRGTPSKVLQPIYAKIFFLRNNSIDVNIPQYVHEGFRILRRDTIIRHDGSDC